MAEKRLTVEEFDDVLLRSKEGDKILEYIGGKLVESLSSGDSSEIGAYLCAKINYFVLQHQLGHVTSAKGGYRISGERYVPSVAFTSKAKWHTYPVQLIFNPLAPDLAVEVISPFDSLSDLRVKVVNYLRAGTTLWMVDPERKSVEVYAPDHKPKVLTMQDTLDGAPVLPGFSLPVSEIFEVAE